MKEDALTLLNACMEKSDEGRHDVFFSFVPHVNRIDIHARAKNHDYTSANVYTMEPEVVYLNDQFYETWPRIIALTEKVKALV